jgi:hypothetical protein
VLGEPRSPASLHFSGSAPSGEPRQRQLPRQIGSWPTSRSWFTSFVLFVVDGYSKLLSETIF